MYRKPSTSQPQNNQFIWQTLPSPILIQILGQCDLHDLFALTLVCRVLHRRVYQLEYGICQKYIRLRRWNHDASFSACSPGDDITFITELFPPRPPPYAAHYDSDGGVVRDDLPEYSFEYLSDLTRCWRTCIRLSFYLAGSVISRLRPHGQERFLRGRGRGRGLNGRLGIVRRLDCFRRDFLYPVYVSTTTHTTPYIPFEYYVVSNKYIEHT